MAIAFGSTLFMYGVDFVWRENAARIQARALVSVGEPRLRPYRTRGGNRRRPPQRRDARNDTGKMEIELRGRSEVIPVSQSFQGRFRGM
jgi:hypothetical protein